MQTLFPSDPREIVPPSFSVCGPGLRPVEKSNVWGDILAKLKGCISDEDFVRWVLPLQVNLLSPDLLVITATDLMGYHTVLDNFEFAIEEAKNKTGLIDLKLRFELQELGDEHSTPTSEDIELGASFSESLKRSQKLNPNYIFSNFVRGPSNQFALATCLNVAENPGKNYNPLFLYGSTGLGKTHLLHAVGNEIVRRHPEAVVTYISSERFMNEMIYCIRHNKMWDFRQKYRHSDLFMMDDIQFISGNKSATQEEFFHTFNSLYEAKKQIIVTSDLFPQDIPDIEERLRNRFQWGLIADIQPPDAEHRIAILMNKARRMNLGISQDVAEVIASYAKKNIRELEGALHRISAYANLTGRTIDRSLALETFDHMARPTIKKTEIETVQKIVADHFKLKVSDLKSSKRQRAVSIPRQISMYLCRKYTTSSFPEIGERFGGKDHTTVMHAVKKISATKSLQSTIEQLERKIDTSACG